MVKVCDETYVNLVVSRESCVVRRRALDCGHGSVIFVPKPKTQNPKPKTQNPKPNISPYASILGGRCWTLDRVRWVLVAGMIATFAVLAIGAHRVDAFAIDVRFTRWVQAHDSTLLDWLTTATNWAMGGMPLSVIGIAIAVVLLLRSHPLDAAVVALATAARASNSGFKEIVASPRPTPDLVRVTDHATGYGYPSGHAASAMLVVGAVAWVVARQVRPKAGRIAVWLFAAALIVLTGIGRVRVGVHWPTDVLGGWLWAGAALLLITGLARRGERARRRSGQRLDGGT
jgi:undecaprenyl-diphosphatase